MIKPEVPGHFHGYKKIGHALLATLQDMGVIYTDSSDIAVVAQVDSHGRIYSVIDGGTTDERLSNYRRKLLALLITLVIS